MPIGYVLRQMGSKIGLEPNIAGDRAVLLRFVNEAASELYDQADTDESLWEQLFKVDGDQQIAFPPEVGPLRAMREYSTHLPWHLYDMRPRYNQSNWKDRWRSWRIKGTSPIMFPVVNQSVMNLEVHTTENPPIQVTISGPSEHASMVFETVSMDANSKQTSNTFKEITAFKKDRVSNFDVLLKDADNNLLGQLPNNMLQMRYRLVDVSLYPWSNVDIAADAHYMEVLYKKALPWFSNDEDEFPMLGYDNVLVNKGLQLWSEEQGKAQDAIMYDGKATRSMARKKEDQNRGIEEEAALVENPHDTLLPRNRPRGPSRYTGPIFY